MATPRKHWFRVADSIADEDFRNDELAFLIRLMAALNTQWARNGLSAEDACRITLSESALMSLADVRRPDAAMGILARLQQKLSISVDLVGTGAPGVYFLHSPSTRLVKIGKTSSLWQRFDALKRERADVQLIGWIPTLAHASLERQLHAEFGADRVEGEWFQATAALLKRASDAAGGQPPRAPQSRAGRLIVAIRWEKWSDFQGLAKIGMPESRPLRKTPPQDARRKTQEGVEEAPPAPAAAPLPDPPKARSKRVRSVCPDELDPDQRDAIRSWAADQGMDLSGLRAEWDACRDHFRSLGEIRADWPATFRTWLRRSARFAARDSKAITAESPAQARARRTKEAGAKAYEMIQQRKLELIGGGVAS